MKILLSMFLIFAIALSFTQASTDTWINNIMQIYDQNGNRKLNWREYKKIV